MPRREKMLITAGFRPLGATTEVVLEHSRLQSRESAANHEKGWLGCLAKLEHLWD